MAEDQYSSHIGKNIKVYVYLMNEGSDAWRPVPAVMLSDTTCRLGGEDFYDPEDEEWQFLPGSKVIVDAREFPDGKYWFAVARAE